MNLRHYGLSRATLSESNRYKTFGLVVQYEEPDDAMFDRLMIGIEEQGLDPDSCVAFTITEGRPSRKRPFMREYTAIKGYFTSA